MNLLALAALAVVSNAAPARPQPLPVAYTEMHTDELDFAFSIPGAAAAIPALSQRLDQQRAERQAEAAQTAREDRADRPADTPFFKHSFEKLWTVAGETPRLLSLKAATSFFTGGAHPNFLFDAMLWDREQDRPLPLAEWFDDPTAGRAAISQTYCPSLDAQRLEKRGGERMPAGTWETDCPALAEHHVAPTDKDGNGRFERLQVLLAPYAAGPYAEGDYIVEVPISAALMKALKPDLQSSFELQPQ
jgi:hypothetical protein